MIGARREIDEGQAEWVRRIYLWYSSGRSSRWISAHLNELGIPSPGASYRRTKRRSRLYGTWSDMTVQGILRNPLYRGECVWNRREWVTNPETEKKTAALRPEEQWIKTTVKDLQIISPALWEKVQARREACRHAPHPPGAAPSGRTPKYLFSSLLRCGQCGSAYVICSRYQYACGGNLYRGASSCANKVRVAKEVVEAKLLASVQRDLLSPEAEELTLKEVRRLLAEHAQRQKPEAGKTAKRLAVVEQEIARMVTAIKDGGWSEMLKAELAKAEAERERLRGQPQSTEQADGKVMRMIPNLRERYRALVTNLPRLPVSRVAEARNQLRRILGDPIVLQPTPEGRLQALVPTGGVVKLAVGAGLPGLNRELSPGGC